MFADPLSVHIFGADTPFPRVGSSTPGRLSVYRTSDGLTEVNVRQDVSAKRKRHEFRITRFKVAADPVSAVNQSVSASVFIVVDEPKFGFTDAELNEMTQGVIKWADGPNLGSLVQDQL